MTGLASSPTARSAERDEGVVGAVAWIHHRIQRGSSSPVGSCSRRFVGEEGERRLGRGGRGRIRAHLTSCRSCSTVAVGVSVAAEPVEASLQQSSSAQVVASPHRSTSPGCEADWWWPGGWDGDWWAGLVEGGRTSGFVGEVLPPST